MWRQYFEARDGKPPLGDAFIRQVGFQTCNGSITPAGGRPEDLLGKPAPDFTLEAAGGGQLHLHELIAGRVAVVAFWRIACGPCRVEAPQLSALYDRYRDKGLVVVAVNGYDESKERVERFVREKGLTHPIGLMGKKIAGDYTVGSYPVTFLVDHTGAVVDYHLDFEPGDEKLLATAIERLLAKREKANRQE